MVNKVMRTLLYPQPLRVLLLQRMLRRLPILNYKTRLDFDLLPRAHYAYCMYCASLEARSLGYDIISVLEFGVGAGHGLLDAEYHKHWIEKVLGIKIKIYGFDLGTGLPRPLDHRDMPYIWQEGFYKMDIEALRKRMRYSELVIGEVAETTKSFFTDHQPAPIGAVFFDLDYYSSTKAALSIFDATRTTRLPRVFSYFDDIIGLEHEVFHQFGGEFLAIQEFNAEHEQIKISPEQGLAHKRKIPARWNDQIFVIHDFDDPNYSKYAYPASRKIKKL